MGLLGERPATPGNPRASPAGCRPLNLLNVLAAGRCAALWTAYRPTIGLDCTVDRHRGVGRGPLSRPWLLRWCGTVVPGKLRENSGVEPGGIGGEPGLVAAVDQDEGGAAACPGQRGVGSRAPGQLR